MRAARNWLYEERQDGTYSRPIDKYFAGVNHPDDYDPTDDELESLILAVQTDALEAAAKICEECAEAIRALFEPKGGDGG